MFRTMRRSILSLVFLAACHANPPAASLPDQARPRLPTGQVLDPAGTVQPIGQMPLAMLVAPGGRRLVMLLNGYRERGVQVVGLDGRVTQNLPQAAAFIGLAFSSDGHTLFASGGNQDVVYRYAWEADSARLVDSLVLHVKPRDSSGVRYPAGLALSPRGDQLYVAENLGDSLAVVDLASGRVAQRQATGRYPYGVAAAPDGRVFVSNWNANTVAVFDRAASGLVAAQPWPAGRHPSALLLNGAGTRLFVASGSTDRVSVIDTRTGSIVAELRDPPPGGVREGSTPNAMVLSPDGSRLFVAEADANAVAVFDLTPATSDVAGASGNDSLSGRIPAGWYPTSLAIVGDSLYIGNGKGAHTGPNPKGHVPGRSARDRGLSPDEASRQYTLGQLEGTLSIVPLSQTRGAELGRLSERVGRANGWVNGGGTHHYPPFEHVIYVLRENRTYDQVLGDLPIGDGDTSLVLFGRNVTPNAHAIATRFGDFDRFFVNSEVSADGHNWSMAAYASDYTQKTTPTQYSGRGRSYDYEGENRDTIPDEDVAEPGAGYLWDLAKRSGISFVNFGEFTREMTVQGRREYRGTKPWLDAHTIHDYPNFQLHIPDTLRASIFQRELMGWTQSHQMPALTILYLPRDHTQGAAAGYVTPKAMVADNDFALGRVIEDLSKSPFWRSTAVFVLEDDAQDGPDHVDSHRSPLLVISAWNRGGVIHRFANTTDVVETIEEILHLEHLSQFDYYGRPLRDIWSDHADTAAYSALTPVQRIDEQNPTRTRSAIMSRRLDFSEADRADMDLFNRVLWHAIKGDSVPYPGPRRMSTLEALR